MNAKEIKNFKLSELIATETGLANFPSTFVELENILQTAKRLQTIRKYCGCPGGCFHGQKLDLQAKGLRKQEATDIS